MRLSDFENEDALDLLADIIEPASEIMGDGKIAKMFREWKPPLLICAEILRHHKKSAVEIIAAMHKESPDTIRFNAITLAKDVLDLLNDPAVQMVFTSQSQESENKSSGSATENIKDKEK